MSQVELAAEMGVSRQTIHAIEKEKYSPSLELAFKLSAFFEKTIEMIFYLEEGKK
ncbi:putative transcriptional regulator [Listeria grayi FSL F6-1183]|uniref:Putative transcriptional regulator n=1 Tax=Listeria grayi FSL F6-1183 TaxID=1265827 RepID=A0A829R9R0_LISGR|nr:putative transcriptional regulator [Listeria grayi FSL F6-1183]